MLRRAAFFIAVLSFAPQLALGQHTGGAEPGILPIRGRTELYYDLTQKRLDTLLPRLMRETGFDM